MISQVFSQIFILVFHKLISFKREKVSRVPSPMLKKTSPVKPEESPVKVESPDKMDSSGKTESPLLTELVKSQVNNLQIFHVTFLKKIFDPTKK